MKPVGTIFQTMATERDSPLGPEATILRSEFFTCVCVCVRKTVAELAPVPIFLYFMWAAATAWLDERC